MASNPVQSQKSRLGEIMNGSIRLVAAGLVLGLGLFVNEARADGIAVRSAQIAAVDRAKLSQEVASARRSHPEAFTSLRTLEQQAPAMEANKHGRFAPFGPMFKQLGPNALFPMLERLALDLGSTRTMNENALSGLRVGMIEAVGSLRDPRAKPVLVAVLKHNETNREVVRASVEALAKLADDDTVSMLVSLANGPHPNRVAVLSAMGECRRSVAAKALSQILQSHPSEEEASALITSLGRMGSAWAWKTPAVQTYGTEEATVRSDIATALVQTFVDYAGTNRQNASDALMMVDAPNTPSLIAQAKAKSPAQSVELDALQRRFDRNPTR